MASPKMPFISSVRLAAIDDSYVVPTCLYYEGNKSFAGREARDRCMSPELLIEDFKLELGKEDLGSVANRSGVVQQAPRRTTVGLAKDFFDQTIGKVSLWLQDEGQPLPKNILVAEPLSLVGKDKDNEGWLTNSLILL